MRFEIFPSENDYDWHSDKARNFLESLPDRKLSKRLDLVRAQQKRAYEKKNTPALQNLQHHEEAIISARMKKFDRLLSIAQKAERSKAGKSSATKRKSHPILGRH